MCRISFRRGGMKGDNPKKCFRGEGDVLGEIAHNCATRQCYTYGIYSMEDQWEVDVTEYNSSDSTAVAYLL